MEFTSLLQRTQGVPPHITAYSDQTPRSISSSSFEEVFRRWPEPPPVAEVPPPQAQRSNRDEMLRRKRVNELRMFFRQGATEMMTTNQIDAAIAAAGIDVDRDYNAQELGKLLNLSVAQYLHFKIATNRFPSSFTPCDLTKLEAKNLRDDFNRPARTAREHERRMALAADEADRAKTAADLDCRQSAIHARLDTKRWKSAFQLSKLLKGVPAFQPLAGPSLKRAVQRVLWKLVTKGWAETKRERSKNGLPMDLFRRRFTR